jgi:sugar O-acyltransferase (sialic acid O-acetyltransferase NeuD family)
LDDLLIYGAGGFGREVHALVVAINNVSPRWRCRGFYVSPELPAPATVHDLPVFRELAEVPGYPTLQVAIGVGAPQARARIAAELAAAGLARAPVLVHPLAWVGPNVTLGPGSVICGAAMVTTDIVLGAHVQVHTGATIGHDCVIGDFVTISPGANISGRVTMQNRVAIGAGAAVIPGVTLGADCVVGAGAAVIRDLAPGVTAVGVPARPIKVTG